jgi:KDO2-lipid IV(A) lauroyltransferase
VRARLTRGLGVVAKERDVLGAFVSAGALLADTLALFDPRERAGRTLTMSDESRRVFRTALDEGRGVVFVTAHLGPWERMAALLAEEGFPVATVARESYDPRLTRLYERLRAPRGVRSVYRGHPGAARRILRELAQAGAVGFLIDLPARVPSLEVSLFNQPMAMPVGPAKIALARRCAVIVGTPGAAAELVLSRVATDGLVADRAGAEELTHRFAAELTRRISATPKAWLGLYEARSG